MPNRDDPLGTLIMGIRQALLMVVDSIEVYFNMPRTSQLRKDSKAEQKRVDEWHGEDGHV